MNEPFADTLLHLLGAAGDAGAAGDPTAGIHVTELAVTMPLEGQVVRRDGKPLFLATAPHTRWRSGVLPAVHCARVVIALATDGAEPSEGT